MPWCPRCKAEFREGITVCSDCHIDLVDEFPTEDYFEPFFQTEQQSIAKKLVKYFDYSGLKAELKFDEENEVYVISVPSDKEKQAKKLYQAFYFVERENIEKGTQKDTSSTKHGNDISNDDEFQEGDKEITDNDGTKNDDSEADYEDADIDSEDYADTYNDEADSEDDAEASEKDEIINPSDEPSSYVMKSDQYKDYTATVWIFLVFGVAGLIVIILDMLGIIHFFNSLLPNMIMAILFLFFIYVAISTNKKAKQIQAEIDTENKLTEEINGWLKTNVTEEFLASKRNDSISDELNFIKISELIRDMLIEEFGPQNHAYLDRLIDEYYSNTFDQGEVTEESEE